MTLTALRGVVLVAAILTQGPPPGIPEYARARGYSSSGSQIVSPTVVATAMTWSQGDAQTLELLVLWRGRPGWFLEGSGHRSGGGGSGDVQTATLEYAGLQLSVTFDRQRRVATVDRRELALRDQNVILVDGVDGPVHIRRISLERVDPAMTSDSPRLSGVLRRSEAVLQFLQCDLKVPQAAAQPTIDMLCSQVRGGL